MDIIKKKLNFEDNNIAFKNNIALITIETTGLNKSSDIVYLINCIIKNNGYNFIQYFSDSIVEEYNILLEFLNLLDPIEEIVTFNGYSFELPFLNQRLRSNKLNLIPREKIFDLHKYISKYKYILNLENYKKTTIEKYLGIDNRNLLDPLEVIKLYNSYLIDKSPEIKDVILKNSELKIINLLKILDIRKLINNKIKFIFNNMVFYFDFMDIRENFLNANGRYFGKESMEINSPSYSLILDPSENTFSFNLEINHGKYSKEMDCKYIIRNNFDFSLKNNYDLIMPNKVFLVELNKEILHKNIFEIFSKILNSLS